MEFQIINFTPVMMTFVDDRSWIDVGKHFAHECNHSLTGYKTGDKSNETKTVARETGKEISVFGNTLKLSHLYTLFHAFVSAKYMYVRYWFKEDIIHSSPKFLDLAHLTAWIPEERNCNVRYHSARLVSIYGTYMHTCFCIHIRTGLHRI